MALDIERYQYVPTYVEAVCVTMRNISEVALWCDGKVNDIGSKNPHIVVPILNPRKVRDSQAYIGHWVVKTPSHGFKVYHRAAFERFFIPTDIMPDEEYDAIVKNNSDS